MENSTLLIENETLDYAHLRRRVQAANKKGKKKVIINCTVMEAPEGYLLSSDFDQYVNTRVLTVGYLKPDEGWKNKALLIVILLISLFLWYMGALSAITTILRK